MAGARSDIPETTPLVAVPLTGPSRTSPMPQFHPWNRYSVAAVMTDFLGRRVRYEVFVFAGDPSKRRVCGICPMVKGQERHQLSRVLA